MDATKIDKAINITKSKIFDLASDNKRLIEQNIILKSLIDMGIAYVVEVDTHTIIYANDNLIKKFGKLEGRTCYKALQGRDTVCPFCTTPKLTPDGHGLTWGYYNDISDDAFVLHDKLKWIQPNGKKYLLRFEVGFELNEESVNSIVAAWKNKMDKNKQ